MSLGRLDKINEIYHCSYKDLENKFDNSDKMIMILGPVRCGKQYSVRQLCFKKSRIFYSNIMILDKNDLVGFYDETKQYQPSELYMAYLNGEVFYIDELSHCSAEIIKELIKINKSISYKFPCGKVYKHKNFRIIASVDEKNFDIKNRNVVSNFDVVSFEYDPDLEKRLCPDDDLYEFISSVRIISDKNKLNIVITSNTFRRYYNILKLGYFTPHDIVVSILRAGYSLNIVHQMQEEFAGKFQENIYFKQLRKMI